MLKRASKSIKTSIAKVMGKRKKQTEPQPSSNGTDKRNGPQPDSASANPAPAPAPIPNQTTRSRIRRSHSFTRTITPPEPLGLGDLIAPDLESPTKRTRRATTRAAESPIRATLRTAIVQASDQLDREDELDETFDTEQSLEKEDTTFEELDDTIEFDEPDIHTDQLAIQATPRQQLPARKKQDQVQKTRPKGPPGSRGGIIKQDYLLQDLLDYTGSRLKPQMLFALTINNQGPNASWTCTFCGKTYKGRDSARIAKHMLDCLSAPEALKARIRADHKPTQSTIPDNETVNQRLSDKQRAKLDDRWVDLITEKGLPLDLGESVQIKTLFQELAVDWLPPTRKVLTERLVPQKVQAYKDVLFEEAREHEYNTLISEHSGMLACKHLGAKKQTANVLFHIFKDIIEEVGTDCFAAIVLDGAANNKAAKQLLKKHFPAIELLDCLCHRLNLVANDWMKHPQLSKWLNKGKKLVKWIRAHGSAKETIRQWCSNNFVQPLEPPVPCGTRWQGIMQLLHFLITMRTAIVACFAEPEFFTPRGQKEKEQWIAIEAITQNKRFWSSLPWLQSLFLPLYEETVRHEAERSTMSEVYPSFCRLKEMIINFKADPSWCVPLQAMYNELNDRYHSTIHALMLIAYLGDPVQRKMHGITLTTSEWEVIEGYLEETEAVNKRVGYKDTIRTQLHDLNAYEGDFDNNKLWLQAIPLKARLDLDEWRRNPVLEGPYTKAKSWWKTHFGHLELKPLMIKALSLRCSTGPAERNWSAFGFIHSKKRNKLTVEHAFELTFLYYNARMERRKQRLQDLAAARVSQTELESRLAEAEDLPTQLLTWEETPLEERMRADYILDNGAAHDDDDWDEVDDDTLESNGGTAASTQVAIRGRAANQRTGNTSR
ncbi:hypothetical protein CERZMDRAFT_107467 [Cercospora zeae-maydis SCOH1-5]|uniref:DUF659 domain-containing protein n=1 Tax=Cercospora zeae-maydis SCOH1-5 TaxID=717836 RepID=A0A6A6F6S8_9PEZI|nr:hypothetical protein CERZMDRAFT_107467 [Cercospora zeae-maydis SCOH1-5]